MSTECVMVQNVWFFEEVQVAGLSPSWNIFNVITPGQRVWLMVAGRGVQSPGRGSNVAVAGPKSRSRVQCRDRGSNVAARENDLGFEVTEWKRLIWKQYKGKKSFYARYSTEANLQVTDVWVNKIMSQEKTKRKKLVDFCVHRKFMGKFSYEYTYA